MIVDIQIRLANKQDVLNKKKLRFGLIYFVKSKKNKGSFCGPLTTAQHTDLKEFSAWFSQKRIYVFVSAFDNHINIINQ